MISTLSNTTLEEIHDAFIDAFSEYEVQMDMPIEKLNEMMITRSFCKDDSLGYFKDDKLLGFILIGLRDIKNKRVYYDVATGVRKENQGEGIGDALLREIPVLMKNRKINRFVLEVLENNISAQNLYKKYGFKIIRRLKCYEYNLSEKDKRRIEPNSIREYDDVILNINSVSYCTFTPSWQNSIASYRKGIDYYNIYIEEIKNKLVGYGIVHKKNGSILQLGLDPDYISIPLLSKIVENLCCCTESKNLKYLNIEEGSIIEDLLISLGFTNFMNQYEMEYKIEREST